MALATSYNINNVPHGARQDISNQLRRVAPEQTPMFATLSQSAAPKALFTEWLVDSLPLPSYDSPLLDGTDLTFGTAGDFTNEIANRVRIGNRIQQFQRQAAVSPLAEQIDIAGPQSSLLAASKARTAVALKTDIESALGSSQVPASAVTTPGSEKGDLLGGFFHFSNPDATTGVFDTAAKQAFRSLGTGNAQDGTEANSRFDVTGGNTLTEANFRNLLQTVYEGGGKSQTYRLFAGPSLMNTLTSYSRAVNAVGSGDNANAFNVNTDAGSIRLSIVELVTDWGIVQVVPSLFLNRTSGSGITAASRNAGALVPADDTVSLKVLQPISVQDLPDVGGGGQRFLTRTSLTLCVQNSRAIGSII
jgi:hypothetical protein